MKSHNCHVFYIEANSICGTLTEVNVFFKQLCAIELSIFNMENFETSIVEKVCKLEHIFFIAFFNVIEHLIMHIPYEAKVGGPVQYKWMYLFERSEEEGEE